MKNSLIIEDVLRVEIRAVPGPPGSGGLLRIVFIGRDSTTPTSVVAMTRDAATFDAFADIERGSEGAGAQRGEAEGVT